MKRYLPEWHYVAGDSMVSLRVFATVLLLASFIMAGAQQAQALTITGTFTTGKYLLTGSPANSTTHAVLKIAFETTSVGQNLSLCAGTTADFSVGHCATQLSDSGGPGLKFLTIVDAATLDGKQLFIIRNVGINAPASFSVTIE
jgi:hypothetical protein